MPYDDTYRPDELRRDLQPIVLPEGKRHGSAWAAMRTACTCQQCYVKREKMRKKGWRPQI